METWQPIRVDELRTLIAEEVQNLNPAERTRWEEIKTPFRKVPIERFGSVEEVFVVAEEVGRLLFYEDIEVRL